MRGTFSFLAVRGVASFRSLALIGLCLAVLPVAARERYVVVDGATCDGYPRLTIGTLRGMCAGLVIGSTTQDPKRVLHLPRSLLQLDADTWLVTDLGAWEGRPGKVWRLRAPRGQAPSVERLLDGLHLPHAIARGPDGLVYIGEMNRIVRFDPNAASPAATLETVVDGLPGNRLHANRHPLSRFVFLPGGDLLVNVGAPSDQCNGEGARTDDGLCAESEGAADAAALRRHAYLGEGRWSREYTVEARGLRNSLALAVHASGTVLQAENSYDFDSRWHPYEELNVIAPGRHFGWPYCTATGAATPAWPDRATWCGSEAHAKPDLLLPPHTAPLDMLWYDGAMFPALRGRLLMSWHGYRSVGGRIASFAVDARGVPIPDRNPRFHAYGLGWRSYGAGPAATPVVLTPGWGKRVGEQPQGSPVGLAVADDGAIWVADDRAGAIIRFAAEE